MKENISKKCLIANSSNVWAGYLKRALEASSVIFSTKTVYTYDDALDKISAERFDIMLLDLNLSNNSKHMQGRELLITLKTQNICIPPTIVVSETRESSDLLEIINNFRDTVVYFIPKEEFTAYHYRAGFLDAIKTALQPKDIALEKVINICTRFPYFARELINSRNKHETYNIKDEYDVQLLFFALLRLYFDDIRPEEYTPKYAGGAARIDFLLEKETIAIEIKKTRKGLTDKEIGNQLTIDIVKYRSHPSCKILICFVYDPDALIVNPDGIKNDLEKSSDISLRIKVIISPK